MSTSTPPRLKFERSATYGAPLVLAGLLLAILAAAFAAKLNVLLPACGMRRVTGLPCPLCGSTRAFLAFSRLDFVPAFLCNPLVFVVCFGVLIWFMIWLIDRFFDQRFAARLGSGLKIVPLTILFFVAAFLNWFYLCFVLPK
jgi:hypothetical protein